MIEHPIDEEQYSQIIAYFPELRQPSFLISIPDIDPDR